MILASGELRAWGNQKSKLPTPFGGSGGMRPHFILVVYAEVERLLSQMSCLPRTPLSRSLSQREQAFLPASIHKSGLLVEFFSFICSLYEPKEKNKQTQELS